MNRRFTKEGAHESNHNLIGVDEEGNLCDLTDEQVEKFTQILDGIY